ncbi:MAG: ABC transporter substrate-binding protein [Candidatus Nezhaarchaeota archaeon]|nr:ABC transporter substrate-binding protein [Candidatus Nezhaarchaeota archaeon]
MAEEAIIRFLSSKKVKGAYQSEIASSIGFSNSTVSYFLSKLEDKGTITRSRNGKSGYRVWLKGFESNTAMLRFGFVRASEYPFIFDLKAKLESEGYGVYLKPYNDGISLMKDLVSGKIDAGFSPLVTQVVFYAAFRGCFNIVASGASGGGSIMLRRGSTLNEVKAAGSTLASTMEVCLRAYLNENGLNDVKVTHFSDPEDMVRALERGTVEIVSIWEPYCTILEAQGHRRIARFSDYLGDVPCCLMAIGQLSHNQIHDVFMALRDALSKRSYSSEVADRLSKFLKLDAKIVEKSIEEYTFHPEYTFNDITNYLKRIGLEAACSWIFKGLKRI